MRSILIAMTVQCLLLATVGVSGAQETHETSQASRDTAVAEGVRSLSEDVRKLSDDVKELVALLKSQQKNPTTESNAPTSSETSPETTQIPNSGTKDGSPARSIQSTFPNAELRDITLVEAKTIALKTLRESIGFSMPERDEIDRIKDEQNLLKNVEDKYWDLWAAFKAFDAYKKEVEATLNCWRIVSKGERVEDGKTSESLARLWETSRHQLHASLNGSVAPPKVGGLRQAELILREALGLNVNGTMLRPTDMPNLNPTQFDWLELNKSALKENVWLKGNRRVLDASPDGKSKVKLAGELAEKELILTHELASCYRLFESNYASLKLNLDWWEANEQEIKIYETRIKDKVGDQNVLFENIARAHQRRTQAEIRYHQSASEYNKALANMKYLCSQLTVGAD